MCVFFFHFTPYKNGRNAGKKRVGESFSWVFGQKGKVGQGCGHFPLWRITITNRVNVGGGALLGAV